jgi:hypothetical protein
METPPQPKTFRFFVNMRCPMKVIYLLTNWRAESSFVNVDEQFKIRRQSGRDR